MRAWVVRHFYHLFLLGGLLITTFAGIAPQYFFASAPRYYLQSSFSGFGVARNSTNISAHRFVVGIGVDPPELWFQYFFRCDTNGTYNFLFVFPFKITSKIHATDNTHFNATYRGSVVWLQYQVNNVSIWGRDDDIWGYFSIENTFQSGTRGSYMFVLPFGMGIHPEVSSKLHRDLGVTFHSPDANISLQVGLPAPYQITQTFPPISAGPNVWETPTNRTITTVEWEFETLEDSVIIFCQDPDGMANYQNYQFISGIGFGIGIPIIAATIFEYVKELARGAREPKPSSKESNNVKKEEEKSSKEMRYRKTNELNSFVAEHAELVKLYIYESEMSWNSAYFHLVLNLGLISAIAVIISLGSPVVLGVISLLSFFGALMSILGFFSLSRTDLFRRFIISKALELEEKMKEMGATLDTFKALKDATSNNTNLKWYERARVHKFQKLQVAGLGVTWLAVAIIAAILFFS